MSLLGARAAAAGGEERLMTTDDRRREASDRVYAALARERYFWASLALCALLWLAFVVLAVWRGW